MHWHELERVFSVSSNKLYLIAMSITGQRTIAEDAVQEALVAVAESNVEPDNPEAYLCRTVRNKALKHAKEKRRFVQQTSETLLVSEGDSHLDRLFASQINQSIVALPPNQRETVILHIFGELTFREIAEIRRCSLNTVTSWYRRGIAALQKGVLDEE